jgi:hypothetical protein
MTTPIPMTPDELEWLAADLDAGVYDDQLPRPPGGLPAPEQPQRFSDLKQFDVKAWAERRGIKLPSR